MPQRRLVVRRYRAKLTDNQLELLSATIEAQNGLFNHALTRLHRMYGPKSKRRFPGTTKAVRSLRSKLIASYLEEVGAPVSKKTGKPRWNSKLMWMSSHQAQALLSKLLTNFGLYWESMDRMRSVMTAEQKEAYKKKYGRPYYAKGRIRKRDENSKPMTVTTPGNGGLALVVSQHHIKVPHFGVVRVHEWINHHKCNRIQQVGLKLIRAATANRPAIVEIQLVIEAPIERKRPADKQVGLDWGMHENTIYTESSGDKHQIPDEIMSRVDQLEMKARKVQSEAQGVSPSRRAALLDRRRYLLAKRSNVMGQYYTSLANTLCSKYDLIAIEGVSPRGMRRRGRVSAQSRGFNRRLALVKPGRLSEITTWAAQRAGTTLLKVDPYHTSQVEFGQHPSTAKKRGLSEREWTSPFTGELIDRDINAAKNILAWGLNPSDHAKHITLGVDPTLLVVKA